MDTTLEAWLALHTFIGHEDPPGKNDDDSDADSDDGDDDGDADADDGADSDKDDDADDDKGDKEDVTGLKKALSETRKRLREERKGRRKAEREAQEAAKTKREGDDAKETEELQTKLTASEQKTQKMAQRLLNKERDDAILAEARSLGFIDPTDALTDEIRGAVEVDQDPDDPSDIEVDEDSVKAAVKKLADKKKHLLGAPGGGTESGGRFRKGGKKKAGEAEKAAQILQDYPSLR